MNNNIAPIKGFTFGCVITLFLPPTTLPIGSNLYRDSTGQCTAVVTGEKKEREGNAGQ